MATAGVNISNLVSSGSNQNNEYPTQENSVFWRLITVAAGPLKNKA